MYEVAALPRIHEHPSKDLLQRWTDTTHTLIVEGHGPYLYQTLQAASSIRNQSDEERTLREYLTSSSVLVNPAALSVRGQQPFVVSARPEVASNVSPKVCPELGIISLALGQTASVSQPVEGAHDQSFNSPFTLSDFVHDFAILSDPPVESSPPSCPDHDLFLESTTGVGTSTPSIETSVDYPTRSSPDFFLPLSTSTDSHEQSSRTESHNANLPTEYLTELSPSTKPLQYVCTCSSLRDITGGKEKRRVTRKRSTKSVRSSTRRDLTPVEIRDIAPGLVRDNAIAFFVENCQSICSGWERLLDRTDQPDSDCGTSTARV
ncbi:hypothetical protein B0J14DRAFT_600990, partial [Halenospora varia]